MNTEQLSSPKMLALCKQRRFLIRTNRSLSTTSNTTLQWMNKLEASLEKVETFLNAYPQISKDNLIAFIQKNKSEFLMIIPSNQTRIRDWIKTL